MSVFANRNAVEHSRLRVWSLRQWRHVLLRRVLQLTGREEQLLGVGALHLYDVGLFGWYYW
jgi:hypothetical protein